MITLRLSDRHATIEGAKRSQLRALDAISSYKVAGAFFSRAFKSGYWDGKEHLLKTSEKHGYRIPIGLVEDVAAHLKAEGVAHQIDDRRRLRSERRAMEWNTDVKPRGYQMEAIRSVLKDCAGSPLFGCGLIKSPIRSGKTTTAAKYIQALGLRTLVIVPSQMLLMQTAEALRRCLPRESIGVVGDGFCDLRFVTVATMQTLMAWRRRKDKLFQKLCETVDVTIIDEAHHLRGDNKLHEIVEAIGSRFRLALSATAYLDSGVEQERGIIWLKACTGPMRVDIGESRLIQEGYLMAQHVRVIRIKGPEKLAGWGWSVQLQRDGIWLNEERNNAIVASAADFVARGLRTLIVTNRVEHTACLSEELYKANVSHEQITGRDNRQRRIDIVDEFVNGSLRVIVGTVFGEGVDIPCVDAVIIAAGGADAKSTMQRMRNMTVSEGKESALLVDFFDDHNKHLRRHSNLRLRVYRSIPEFTVDMGDVPPRLAPQRRKR